MTETTGIAESTPATLDERVAGMRAKLRSTRWGYQMMQDLAPVDMANTDAHNFASDSHIIVDFTDWRQWGQQWSQY